MGNGSTTLRHKQQIDKMLIKHNNELECKCFVVSLPD